MTITAPRLPVAEQIFGANKAPIGEVLAADYADLLDDIRAKVSQAEQAAKEPKNDADQAALGVVIMDCRALWKRADALRTEAKAPILEAGRELDAWFKAALTALVDAGERLQKLADGYARQKAAEERARAQREAEEARRRAEDERAKAEAARTAAGAARAEGRAEAFDAHAESAEAQASASDAELVRSRVGGVTASAKGAWTATIVDYQAAIGPLGVIGNFLKRDAVEAALVSMARVQKDGASWPGVSFYQDTKATFRK